MAFVNTLYKDVKPIYEMTVIIISTMTKQNCFYNVVHRIFVYPLKPVIKYHNNQFEVSLPYPNHWCSNCLHPVFMYNMSFVQGMAKLCAGPGVRGPGFDPQTSEPEIVVVSCWYSSREITSISSKNGIRCYGKSIIAKESLKKICLI